MSPEPPGALADVIYAHGKAISEGLIERREAIEYLTRRRGFTATAAVTALAGWRTVHAWLGGAPCTL